MEGLDEDVISRQDHEQETEKLELEIQQCKEMIRAQQQLLQVGGSGLRVLLNLLDPCSCIAQGLQSCVLHQE